MNANTSSSPDAALLAAIEKLKRDWPQLSNLDRAWAVARIRKPGVPIRGIARELECSEASLRHLLSALQAPAADLAAARKGELSTNELVRRAKAEALRQKKSRLKTRELERKRKVIEVSNAICRWLENENLGEARGEAVALEARSMLIADYKDGQLPHADPHVVHPAAEWIEKCRPKTPMHDDSSYISWYALWLARWSFCFCRHPEIAIDALAKAGQL